MSYRAWLHAFPVNWSSHTIGNSSDPPTDKWRQPDTPRGPEVFGMFGDKGKWALHGKEPSGYRSGDGNSAEEVQSAQLKSHACPLGFHDRAPSNAPSASLVSSVLATVLPGNDIMPSVPAIPDGGDREGYIDAAQRHQNSLEHHVEGLPMEVEESLVTVPIKFLVGVRGATTRGQGRRWVAKRGLILRKRGREPAILEGGVELIRNEKCRHLLDKESNGFLMRRVQTGGDPQIYMDNLTRLDVRRCGDCSGRIVVSLLSLGFVLTILMKFFINSRKSALLTPGIRLKSSNLAFLIVNLLIWAIRPISTHSAIIARHLIRCEHIWIEPVRRQEGPEELIRWDRERFGHVRRRVRELEEKLEAYAKDPISASDNSKRRALRGELDEFLTSEEILWKQGAKLSGFEKGIGTLLTFMCERVLGKRRILSLSSATKRTSGPSTESIDEILRGMPRSVNEEMNEALIQPSRPKRSLLTSIPKGDFVKEIPYPLAFSRNTSDDIRAELANILGVCVVAKHEKYLGLPALMGCSKRDIFKIWRIKCGKDYRVGSALICLKPRSLFILGLQWHIGTGQNVCIWKNRWFPRPWKFQGGWNEALIRSFFRPEDAGLVLGIGRSVGSPDHLCWHFEKRGHYSVRRAYRIIGEGVVPHLRIALAGLDCLLAELVGMHFLRPDSRIRLLFENNRVSEEELLERVWGLEHSLSRTSRSALDLENPIKQTQKTPFNFDGIG
ncbi:UNVERIFIED_CONTAM: hypothetical protein Scaly_3077200 [Sesamum calycinum]|uniref:Uncharacterized protein n=1 Tax=Sesamum calycinum TaxID=2727403 RepID=A0AAW2JV66_9LAMI